MIVSFDYLDFEYIWPSTSIMFEVYNASLELPSQLTYREMFRLCEGHTFLGKVYEYAVRRAVHSSSVVLSLYDLTNEKSSFIELHLSSSVLVTKIDPSDFKKVFNDAPNQHVFWPLSKTQASFDFIQPPYIFQITMSTNHPVISYGLFQVMKCFPSIKKWNLVYVIPFPIAAQFKRQSIIDDPNKPLNRSIQQYMAVIDYKESMSSNCQF